MQVRGGMVSRLCSLAFMLCVSLQVVHAQFPDQTVKLRLAQSHEQSGNLEHAATLYAELHAADEANAVYFDGLRRVLLQLKRYDETIALLHKRVQRYPADVNLLASLGSVQYKAGNEKEAITVWERAIAVEPANPNVYRILSGVLIENRLLEKTAELYRRARTACGDPNLFTIDLAQLLAVTMDYTGATTEFIRWLRQNPTQLAFVQGRMTSFTGKQEGRLAALQVVRSELSREEDLRLYELLGWLFMEGKEFSAAFDVFKRIDRMSNTQGVSIYGFAERAFKEGAYEVAAKAYLEAINLPIAAARMPFAKYGYASSLKELSILSDTTQRFPYVTQSGPVPATESQPHYAGAITYFQKIIQEYPSTEFSARSYYQIGRIQLEKFFDLDGALNSFERVERELPSLNIIAFSVSLKIGEVLTAKGDTGRAAARFRGVIDAPNATPDQHDEAAYRLAELEYFNGQFAEAIERLDNIAINLNADYANDALVLLSFLRENTGRNEAALREVARADFLARQGKNSEAIPILLKVIEQPTQTPMIDDALMKIATLQARTGQYQDAIESYERLLSEFRESSIALDRARFNIGELFQYAMRDATRAIAAYEQLLAEYPQSLLATEARKRIRTLRGDTL